LSEGIDREGNGAFAKEVMASVPSVPAWRSPVPLECASEAASAGLRSNGGGNRQHDARDRQHIVEAGEHGARIGSHIAGEGEHRARFGSHIAEEGEHRARFGSHIAEEGDHRARFD
jgi:hypothetical protein